MNYKLTNDYFFKRIFGQERNKDLLIDLLSSILPEIEIKDLKVNQEVSLEKEVKENKLCRLDILATLNDNTKVNIEMQMDNYSNTIERSIYYNSKIINKSLNESQNYVNLPKVIGIWIVNYEIFEEGPFHEKAKLKREYENIVLTEKFELHYIQLAKFRKKCKRISTKLEEWLTFIDNNNLEELGMIKNEKVKKAEKELELLNSDEYEKELARIREESKLDEKWALDTAYLKGLEAGKEQGLEQGKIEEIKNTAKKMLKKNFNIAEIKEITGLSEEEIEKLKENL